MARLSGLAERSFKRRFQQATGMSPQEYVHTLRLEEAEQMLEAGNQPIESMPTRSATRMRDSSAACSGGGLVSPGAISSALRGDAQSAESRPVASSASDARNSKADRVNESTWRSDCAGC